jgi:hypothetical protein
MAKQDKAKSKPNAPRTRSLPVSAKAKSIPETTVTKIKIKKFIHPDDIDKASSPEQEETVISAPEPILDISPLDYTLRTSRRLDETPVFEDTTFYKLTEFAYHPFHIMASKKIERAVVELKIEFEWISGMTILYAKSIAIKNHLRITVDDTEGWKKIE